MKIGYACINTNVGCTANSSFILRSYSVAKLKQTVAGNLECLEQILKYNQKQRIRFFRIGSSLVPFASHPVCKFDWQNFFKSELARLGNYARQHGMRLAMHPGQYTVINSPDKQIVQRAVRDLVYHTEVLDLMKLPLSAKVQIHVGGAYGDKSAAIDRFIKQYHRLPTAVKRRLVVENDERLFSLTDCLKISRQSGMPVLCDILHHKLNNEGESLRAAVRLAGQTWKSIDGVPIVDYSTPRRGGRRGSHSQTIGLTGLKNFLKEAKGLKFDLMLEVKDKNISAERVQRKLEI